jgi:ABC-type lipoprotein export system ATPase subunit
MSSVIGAEDVSLHHRRGGETVVALRRVSLTLDRGELVALRGPSGSGKTSLLSLLCGWESPTTGLIEWHGDRGADLRSLLWSEIAIVPQSLGLLEELTLRENIELPRKLSRSALSVAGADLADTLDHLGLVGLGHRLPGETSLGEQQRAAVARGVVSRPTLLLADEPTAHQDSESATRVWQALAELAGTGGCCLVATHSAEAVRFASRVVELEN